MQRVPGVFGQFLHFGNDGGRELRLESILEHGGSRNVSQRWNVRLVRGQKLRLGRSSGHAHVVATTRSIDDAATFANSLTAVSVGAFIAAIVPSVRPGCGWPGWRFG